LHARGAGERGYAAAALERVNARRPGPSTLTAERPCRRGQRPPLSPSPHLTPGRAAPVRTRSNIMTSNDTSYVSPRLSRTVVNRRLLMTCGGARGGGGRGPRGVRELETQRRAAFAPGALLLHEQTPPPASSPPPAPHLLEQLEGDRGVERVPPPLLPRRRDLGRRRARRELGRRQDRALERRQRVARAERAPAAGRLPGDVRARPLV
jgi:hypothetical protein